MVTPRTVVCRNTGGAFLATGVDPFVIHRLTQYTEVVDNQVLVPHGNGRSHAFRGEALQLRVNSAVIVGDDVP
jgi:hypothetical protein